MRALERVIAILEAVADSSPPVTPTTTAGRVDLSQSTLSRLMREMADYGLLERDESDGSYSLGARLVEIARASLRPKDLVDAALPVMRNLRNTSSETVALHVRRVTSRICVAQVQSLQPVHRVVPVGFTVPLHYGATGEALMAGMELHDLNDYLATLGLPPLEVRALTQRLALVRERGWIFATNSWTPGLSGVSAPIVVDGETAAVISVSGPTNRLTEDVLEALGPSCAQAASRIAVALGSYDAAA